MKYMDGVTAISTTICIFNCIYSLRSHLQMSMKQLK